MTQLTKADIDGFLTRLAIEEFAVKEWPTQVYEACYRVAGLQADGSPKPEKVPAWLYMSRVPNGVPVFGNPTFGTWDGTTFIPDGAE